MLVAAKMILQLLPKRLMAKPPFQDDWLVVFVFFKAKRTLEIVDFLPDPIYCSLGVLVHLGYLFFRRPLLPKWLDPVARSIYAQFLSQQYCFFFTLYISHVVPFSAYEVVVVDFPATRVLVQVKEA